MKIIMNMLFFAILLNADGISNPLTLDNALNILKNKNIEIKVASIDEDVAKANIEKTKGMNWGKLEFIQDISRSNDAGNVFGFKLTSREATFGDFGAREFISSQTPTGFPNSAYTTPPNDLNYPDARNFFQSKIKYELPIFTGFKIQSYTNIMKEMAKMKGLDKDKLVNEKVYQLKKSFYDMALLEDSIKHLNKILNNINILEDTTKEMINEGYAKHVDLLEVQAKKANVKRLVLQMQSNKKLLYHYISFLLNKDVTSIIAPTQSVKMPNYSDKYISKNNLDIQKASLGLNITKNMEKVSKSAYYPMIGAFAEESTADDNFLTNANEHKAYTIGARVSWNIFNGGIDKANMQKARLNSMKTQEQVQLAKMGIKLKIAKIRTEIETYDNEIASLKKELLLANTIYKNYEGRYKEKLISMNDVIIKQSQQIEKILQLQQIQNKRNERVFAFEKLANGEK